MLRWIAFPSSFLSGEDEGLGFAKSAAGELLRALLEHSSVILLLLTALLLLV
jgi:hypothetical protein